MPSLTSGEGKILMKQRKRFAIVIGVAAVGVMALGAQTGAQTPAPTPQARRRLPARASQARDDRGLIGNDTLRHTWSGCDRRHSVAMTTSALGGNDVICGGPRQGQEAQWPQRRRHPARSGTARTRSRVAAAGPLRGRQRTATPPRSARYGSAEARPGVVL